MEASKFLNQMSRLLEDYVKLAEPVKNFTKLASVNEKQAGYILKSGVTFQHYLGHETKYNFLENFAFKQFSALVNGTELSWKEKDEILTAEKLKLFGKGFSPSW